MWFTKTKSSDKREGSLFAEYINAFMKLKTEASGSTDWVRSPAEQERFIESFWKSMVMRLDRESFKANAA